MSYIRVVRWASLSSRAAPEAHQTRIGNHPTVRLGDVLKPRNEPVKLGGSFETWSPITVHLNGDISVRVTPKPYKGSTFAAYPGDVVFSKIDARNGAIGVVPPSIGRAVVTAEFPVLTSDPLRLDPDYLKLVLRSAGFHKALKARATGHSGRKRITAASFLALEVPLPSLLEQQTIVQTLADARAKASALREDATSLRRDAERAFVAGLGVPQPVPLPRRPLFISKFSAIEKWSHEGALRSLIRLPEKHTGPYPLVELGSVANVSYGIAKAPRNRPASHARPYLRVANVQRGYLDLRVMKRIDVSDAEMQRYALREGDVLLCEGNSSDLVGRGAIWQGEIPNCVHQNHVIRVRAEQDMVDPEFILAVVNSDYGQDYFGAQAKRTTNLASINSTEVARFPLPLPPIETQKILVSELRKALDEENECRMQSALIEEAAMKNAEARMFL